MTRPNFTCPSAGRGFERDSRSPSCDGGDECPECGSDVEIDVDSCGDGTVTCTNAKCDFDQEIYGPTGD